MHLSPIETERLSLAYGWLTSPEIAKWLDFGETGTLGGRLQLQMLLRRPTNYIRFFAPEPQAEPAGIVAFSYLHQTFRTAMLWYALGDSALAGQGLTSRAVSTLLRVGFEELGLGSVHAWAVPDNKASIRVLERNGFRPIGRQRRCHRLDGRMVDRLLFDLLREEFQVR